MAYHFDARAANDNDDNNESLPIAVRRAPAISNVFRGLSQDLLFRIVGFAALQAPNVSAASTEWLNAAETASREYLEQLGNFILQNFDDATPLHWRDTLLQHARRVATPETALFPLRFITPLRLMARHATSVPINSIASVRTAVASTVLPNDEVVFLSWWPDEDVDPWALEVFNVRTGALVRETPVLTPRVEQPYRSSLYYTAAGLLVWAYRPLREPAYSFPVFVVWRAEDGQLRGEIALRLPPQPGKTYLHSYVVDEQHNKILWLRHCSHHQGDPTTPRATSCSFAFELFQTDIESGTTSMVYSMPTSLSDRDVSLDYLPGRVPVSVKVGLSHGNVIVVAYVEHVVENYRNEGLGFYVFRRNGTMVSGCAFHPCWEQQVLHLCSYEKLFSNWHRIVFTYNRDRRGGGDHAIPIRAAVLSENVTLETRPNLVEMFMAQNSHFCLVFSTESSIFLHKHTDGTIQIDEFDIATSRKVRTLYAEGYDSEDSGLVCVESTETALLCTIEIAGGTNDKLEIVVFLL